MCNCELVLYIYLIIVRFHLIIEDALISAISWLDVGTLFLFFPLPLGVTAFPCIKFERCHQIYPHLNSVMEVYENEIRVRSRTTDVYVI